MARYDRLAAEAEGRSKELKMRSTGESGVDQKKTATGDEELDEMINYDLIKLTYLAAPVPIKPVRPK